MTCDAIRQLLLSLELTERSRQRVYEALAHLQSCDACRHAMKDFDKLAALLQTGQPLDDSLPALEGSEDEEPTGVIASKLADQSEVSPMGGWEAFESTLLAATRGNRYRLLSIRNHWWLPALGSLAALVLVGWGAYQQGKKASQVAGVQRPLVAPSHSMLVAVRLSPDEVAEKVRTFDAVDRSFDGKTCWLMLSGPNNTDVGLISQCPESPITRGTGDKILLVRLNLVRGADVVSQADLLIVAGTTANVLVPTKLGHPLQYHIVTSALDPMRLRVQVQVAAEVGADNAADNAANNGAGNAAGSHQSSFAPTAAILGTCLELEPYLDASAGRLVLERQAFDLQVAAAASSLPG